MRDNEAGKRIREVRKQKGLSLQRVADSIGCSVQAISQYERDTRPLTIDMVKKIAGSLEVNWRALLNLKHEGSGGDMCNYRFGPDGNLTGGVYMIQLDEASARRLSRFGEEVLNIDDRARCSDKYFRQHFIMLARNPYMQEAFSTLQSALNNSVAPEHPPDLDEQPQPTEK